MENYSSAPLNPAPGTKAGLSIISVFLGLIWLLSLPAATWAQTSIDTWTPPENLSRSGGTINPNILADSSGAIHVIWTDEFEGSYYSRREGEIWSPPDIVVFPFDDYLPVLTIDGLDRAHAFWIEDDEELRYSRANIDNFGTSNGWTGEQILARSAIKLEVQVDAEDRLHLIYLRPTETESLPAGIYYRKSTDGGISWTPAIALYESPYLRVLTADDANLSLWVTDFDGETQLYAAWDNRPQKRLIFRQSGDGGATWEDPASVVLPTSTSSAVFPFGVEVGAVPGQIVLVWVSGFPGGNCDQYYQKSNDNGLSWSEPQKMLDDIIISGCPTENRLFTDPAGQLFLWTSFQDQAYWQAWDGTRWSRPRTQPNLANFNDPETRNLVTFRCQQYTVDWTGQLFVVGCDESTGGISGGDIWFTSTPLGDAEDWFPPPSAWQEPDRLLEGNMYQRAPLLLVDGRGKFHALWRQPDAITDVGESSLESSIYYSVLEDGIWSDPALVVQAGSGRTGPPAAFIDSTDRIHLIFTDEKNGEVYYSWAESTQALNSTEWNSPTLLFSSQPVHEDLNLLADPNGDLLAVFAVPVNEQRGVYLLKSEDRGLSWSAPSQIFDGGEAGWEIVTNPQLAVKTGGNLHLLVRRGLFVQVDFPPNLYYLNSRDGGLNWTEPEIVGDQFTDWSAILAVGDRTVHRIWRVRAGDQYVLAHEFSLDNALTWTRLPDLISIAERGFGVALFDDRNEQVHILQIAEDLSGELSLSHRIWEMDDWVIHQTLNLGRESISQVNALSGVISPQGDIVALFNVDITSFQEHTQETVLYTSSEYPLSGEAPTPLPPLQPTTVVIESPEIIVMTPTPTPPIFLPQTPSGPISAGTQWIGAVVGAALSGLVVLAVIVFGLRQRRDRK